MEMIFHSHANKKLISDKKSSALGLILRVRVFGTRKWLIIGPGKTQCGGDSSHGLATLLYKHCEQFDLGSVVYRQLSHDSETTTRSDNRFLR